jgi:uncharacterized protein YqhQ
VAETRFYGGQAVIEGVMMRGRDVYATAVRRRDGSVVIDKRPVPHLFEDSRWAKLPFIRGTIMLIETLTLGLRSLQFSGNVAIQDEIEAAKDEAPQDAQKRATAGTRRRPWLFAAIVALAGAAVVYRLGPKVAPFVAARVPGLDTPEEALLPARIALGVLFALFLLLLLRTPKERPEAQPQPLSDTALWLALVPALALGLGLFILLPSSLAGFVKQEGGYGVAILKNVVEGIIRLALIIGYIAAISLLPDIRRVFQYHGAEHKVINTLELEGQVGRDPAGQHSPLHPRCGTAFLLLFIVLKIIIGCFFGWPIWYWRLALRLAMVPLVAAIAYEMTRLAGKYRDSAVVRFLTAPALLLQRLTTREPEPQMIDVAIYALASVAPEVSLPAGWPPPAEFSAARPDGAGKAESLEGVETE